MESKTIILSSLDAGTLTVTPLEQITSLPEVEVQLQCEEILSRLQDTAVTNVILDMGAVSYFGSSMIKWMVTMWKQVRERQGKFIVCELSPVGTEILEIACFDKLWQIEDTRLKAQQAVGS